MKGVVFLGALALTFLPARGDDRREVAAAPLPQSHIAHEFVPFAPGERGPQPLAPRPAVAERALPDAIAYRGLMLPAPAAGAEPRRDEPVLRPSAPPGAEAAPSALSPEPASAPAPEAPAGDGPPEPTRSARYDPDGVTTADPTLRYASTFQPSVAPFKRFDVKDAVAPDFSLGIGDSRLRPLGVGGVRLPGRELFFGSVVLLASAGAAVPLPSVAAGARILRYETTPRFRARFFRDGADNQYVAVSTSGLVRLNFLTDAPSSYFGGALPASGVDAVPELRRPRLPPAVRTAALEALEKLGVSREATADVALRSLVRHFRSYRAGASPPARTRVELFRQLALAGLGACRHRAYAFTILVQALGFPARFVANEAHAFAEAWLPGNGWRRIDLGGVSPELVVYGAEDKVAHRPRNADPFPRPSDYARNYSIRAGPSFSDPPPLPPGTDVARIAPDALPPSPEQPPPTAPPGPPGREPTRLLLSAVQRDVLRGEALELRGRVETLAGRGAPGLRVEVYLTEIGSEQRLQIGVLLTDAEGNFRAHLPISRDLEAGRYRLHAETAGSRDLASASSLP